MDLDDFTSLWTLYLTYASVIYCFISSIVIFVTLIVLFKVKSSSDTAFFTIYKYTLITNVISIFASHILLYKFIVSAVQTCEWSCNLYCCLNRASTIIFPFHHAKFLSFPAHWEKYTVMVTDSLTSSWTHILTLTTMIHSTVSVIIGFLLLVVITKEKSYSNNVFFTIYTVTLLSDIASIFFNHIPAGFPALGWFHEIYSSSTLFIEIFLFFSFFTRTLEVFGNTYLCLN
ncbi:hypothetical protein PRIPAC_81690 [Pristionchus pacificus]|uniref:Uncharacterized protein n=1 Tax=Pristionchus pacificus TaxID=54126 RepID=A0A2A6CP98_PRIPA|nr:hypothetical protein PRIPAC_81690 [Pristionchus pacificus]|eukprot:PDM79959.1 hypothetical protein PRIPAC_32538 [Pristionchus pacificus]